MFRRRRKGIRGGGGNSSATNPFHASRSAVVSKRKRLRSRKSRQNGGIALAVLLLSVLMIVATLFHTLVSPKSLVDDYDHHPPMMGHPTVVLYDFEMNSVVSLREPLPRIIDTRRSGHVLRTNDSSSSEDDVCQPMHEWQTSSYILCNPLHEFDMISETIDGTLVFINCGGDRCAFRIKDVQGTPLALKIPKFHKVDASHHDYESSRIDGMAMERLTSSHYVLSTYGYCGLSQVIEFGGGSIHDLVKRARLDRKDDMDPIDKLKVAIQLVTAVADLHTFEKDGQASISHNDVCCHQFILVDGVYKLNDFHLSKFLKKDVETNEVCQHPMALGSRWRLIHSPEEITEDAVDNEKADDYVVGNVIYYVLTKEWIFEHVPNSRGIQYLVEGKRSPFPPHIRNSAHPADQALMEAIMMCWTHNVNERPSSREVSEFLMKRLEEISGERVHGAVRVSIPPLPENWDYGDSDFDSNFDD